MTVSEGARRWLSNEDEKLARFLYREIWLLRENCAKKATGVRVSIAIYTATTPSGKSRKTKLNPIY